MYAQTFSVTGGTSPYRWQLSGTPPAGLSFADGQLSGVPQAAGNGAFTVLVTDAGGNIVQADTPCLSEPPGRRPQTTARRSWPVSR
ncbi:putative Ig domain-containing protein [Pantoea ananatis]|uniref:putative Ig domain-containing protein n=1 Tax=Pantoea ananas TaxID=553 RepID=UPI001C8A80DC|nr:putative Ig domain-containing protein [Pantoea ananatis]QZE31389.1 putative Ig domain-containing protein [Pantoea ananatis]